MEQSAVIKSKVDISRNLNGYSFPHKLSSQEAEIIIQKVKNIFLLQIELIIFITPVSRITFSC